MYASSLNVEAEDCLKVSFLKVTDVLLIKSSKDYPDELSKFSTLKTLKNGDTFS